LSVATFTAGFIMRPLGSAMPGSKLAPAGYVAACVLLSLIFVSILKEAANKSID
jgi:hypothetical protein